MESNTILEGTDTYVANTCTIGLIDYLNKNPSS